MDVPLWQRGEWVLTSDKTYDNPLQEASVGAIFTSPSGKQHKVYGFWDGDKTWRVRFAPDEQGEWSLVTTCSDSNNKGLQTKGIFQALQATGATRFQKHGSLRLSSNRRYFIHADGTPFFWLADTVWNGPMLSTDEDWQYYLNERVRQKFTAAQWVATQFLAAPDGDRFSNKAYEGHEKIKVNLEFYKHLEQKHNAIITAGLLSVPTLLWAAHWNPEVTKDNPGAVLPEDQAILLARYMVARWGADAVAWFLPGDANYQGEDGERWRRIGRAVFGDITHAPVTLHPNGQQWIGNFKNETWIDFMGYQSGHGDGTEYDKWLLEGPPTTKWSEEPIYPVINLEPPYENHIAYQSQQPFSPLATRKRLYWSLLVSPTAGVTYGGHGVWGWDDGRHPPTAHPKTGIPLPWREALRMPAAEQVTHLYEVFDLLEWWRLRPAPELLVAQPGKDNSEHYIVAARSDEGDIALVYAPENTELTLNLSALSQPLQLIWLEPRSGQEQSANGSGSSAAMTFTVPEGEDWLLVLRKQV
jgi:Protein of unknown function (DUF4038)/Domain of unknown function (DUF5060)/Putative collagen-binding domain of a collagenase